jgi:hypothetical protein
MREWCSCGAAIHASARNVREWRGIHHCPDRPEREPEKSGSFANVERAAQFDHDSAHRIIGFRAEERLNRPGGNPQ